MAGGRHTLFQLVFYTVSHLFYSFQSFKTVYKQVVHTSKTPPRSCFVGYSDNFYTTLKVDKSRGNPAKKLIWAADCLSEITPVVRVLFRTKSSSLSLKSISQTGDKMVACETAIFTRCNYWLYLPCRKTIVLRYTCLYNGR